MEQEGPVALLRVRQGYGRNLIAEDLPQSFIIREEECMVLIDRAAKRTTKLIANKHLLHIAHRLKRSDRIQIRIPQVVVCLAVKLVGASPGSHIDHSARGATILRRVVIRLNAKL